MDHRNLIASDVEPEWLTAGAAKAGDYFSVRDLRQGRVGLAIALGPIELAK